VAVVGQLAGTGHFRNINRHDVVTFSNLLMLRIDESLFFGNSESVHRRVIQATRQYPEAPEIILIMSAVNHIDLTGQEMLISLNQEQLNQKKHLSIRFINRQVKNIIEKTAIITHH